MEQEQEGWNSGKGGAGVYRESRGAPSRLVQSTSGSNIQQHLCRRWSGRHLDLRAGSKRLRGSRLSERCCRHPAALGDGAAHRRPAHVATATACNFAQRPSTPCITNLSHVRTVTLVCIGLYLGGKGCGVASTATETLPSLLPRRSSSTLSLRATDLLQGE